MNDQSKINEIVDELYEVRDESDIIEPINNFRRRMTIRYLSRLPEDGSAETRELATAITALELDMPMSEVSNSDYKRTYEGLSQRDLKKLSMDGIIERKNKNVTRGDRFDFYAGIINSIDGFLEECKHDPEMEGTGRTPNHLR
jgi:hypothetical protein